MKCSSGDNGATENAAKTFAAPPPDGQFIFKKFCTTCHGADGKLGLNGAKDFSKSVLTLEERVAVISNGRNLMTPFKEILAPKEIEAVAKYTQNFK